MGKALAKKVVKAVYFVPTLEIGGAERQLLAICRALCHEESIIVLSKRKGDLRKEFTKAGLRQISLPSNSSAFSVGAVLVLLFLAIRHRRIILESFLPISTFLSAVAKSLVPGKIILIGNRRSHLFYRTSRPLLSRIDRWSTSKCDFLVCNSDSVLEEAIRVDGVSSKLASVIPNGVDASIQVFSKRTQRRPLILHVANHHKYKKTNTLLESLAASDLLRTVEVHMFGLGEETEVLRKFVQHFELDLVTFHGQVEDPWSVSAPGDIYVHTSETEGFSNSVLEAMAHGLVPVVTDIESNRYVAGNVAEYFSVGNDLQLRKLLEQLIHDSKRRIKIGQAGFTRVQKKFSISSATKKRMELHHSLWSRRTPLR
jgi:glycosyltransferase involved in cell wall biosynthesis